MDCLPSLRSFRVQGAPQPELIAGWEWHNAAELIELTCAPPRETEFSAREINLRLGRAALALVRGSAHTVRRGRRLIEMRPSCAIVAYIMIRGHSQVEHATGQIAVRPGQMLLCDADQPLRRRFDHGVEELAIRVPHAEFAKLAGASGLPRPILVNYAGPGVDPYARALARITGQSLRHRAAAWADDQTVLELVSWIACPDTARRSLGHLAAARVHIAEHLTETELSTVTLAEAIGVSERHLSRLFAGTGVSVPQYILSRRLDLAYRELSDARATSTTAEVAARCGFGSPSHFSRAFHRRFGTTAGAVRARGHAVKTAQPDQDAGMRANVTNQ